MPSSRPARERKRLTTGKCEGRKSHAEINPEMVAITKGLRRRKRGKSLRAIAADLAARGYVNANGRAFSAASVASMLGRLRRGRMPLIFVNNFTARLIAASPNWRRF